MQAQELLEIVLDDMPAENAPALLAFLQERGACSRVDGSLAGAMNETEPCCFIFPRMNLGRELRKFSAHFYFGNGTWEVCLLFLPALPGMDFEGEAAYLAPVREVCQEMFATFRPRRIVCGFESAIDEDMRIFTIGE
ncbi:MAG: hypothetical protein IKU14_00195 [Rhodocyclaceae bacterium]|nr:hypothetical protein [Rhodocyclaceae bacterium]